MSDDVKDFAYYAAKVEETLAIIPDLVSAEGKRLCVAKADVYARLACGAPKPGPCSARLNSNPPSTVGLPCTLTEGHSGDHKDYRGVYFVS